MSTPSAPARATVQTVRDDEVLTGEAVALDVQPVGMLLRATGALIDVAVSVVLYVLFALAMGLLAEAGVLDDATMQIALVAMLVLLLVIVPTAVETVTRGRSLGKLAVGGRVVRADGGAIGFRHAVIRALVGVFEIYMTAGGVALLVGIFTPRAQRLGDLVAGTYGERTRTPRLPPADAGVPPGMEQWAAIADVARLPDALGRRVSQFASGAERMFPAARLRVAEELAGEVSSFVAPVPQVAPETLLRAVVAVRRDRELRALLLQNERVARLSR
ncbi:RDD family protein [Microbacterium betulae]|uniref:RDD family protein n=1 Tax=Microbacterium betulae TaxID=2981139 RepID=A0AA97I5W6_9MICO|nr:RDD family protein [Microbacterium sp. AB]WOF24196.1 RDD family protein [Microbacterium sp. AB]